MGDAVFHHRWTAALLLQRFDKPVRCQPGPSFLLRAPLPCGQFSPVFKNLGALLRKNFFAGLLVVTPIAVSVWILLAAMRAVWGLQSMVPEALQPERLFPEPWAFLLKLGIAVGGALLLALLVSVAGWSSKQIIGRKVLLFLAEDVIQHIPVVRSIYSALDQLLQTMAAGGSEQFSRVVYVEYPRKGMLTLAFVTGSARGKGIPPAHLNVYVPTTPNPTSGFYLIVAEAEIIDSDLSVEDAFKTILSLGLAAPDTRTAK